MKIRKPRYNKNGSIDVELDHPRFGWVPFTASSDDVENHGRLIYEDCISGAYGEIEEYIEDLILSNE